MDFVDRSFVSYIYIYIYGESNDAGKRTKLKNMVFNVPKNIGLAIISCRESVLNRRSFCSSDE